MSSQTPTETGLSMEWVEHRRAALERFLCRTSQHPVLSVDPEFINFLQSDEVNILMLYIFVIGSDTIYYLKYMCFL